ncbi:hypothetical protein B0H11DRAFT_1738009, partial [Mycena galericulata]
AVLALAPGSIFSVNTVARTTVSGSSISTGAGLPCDIYLLLRFSLASVPVFKTRAQDKYEVLETGSVESYVFFALVARLPLLLASVSVFFISVLLAHAAYKLSPVVVLIILDLTVFILSLQYLCWVLVWMVFGLSKVPTWLAVAPSMAGTWFTTAFKKVTQELWISAVNCSQ